jgi:hypothetical protein
MRIFIRPIFLIIVFCYEVDTGTIFKRIKLVTLLQLQMRQTLFIFKRIND